MATKLEQTSATTREFTLQFLEQITDDFSEKHIIGRGGYGVVYKGELENGEEIALKRLHYMPGLDDTQFRNEFNNLIRAQHPNITRLIGYCYNIGHQRILHKGEYVFALLEERLLCFEYLPGGSLDKHITDESCGLDWHTRFKIIEGVCDGLNYLHNGCEHPIYHLDLKPANILLDKNLVPKIGDFGLSRLFPSTQTYITIKIIGTPGYMPPEYIERYEITPKYDVFSLGVIIVRIMAVNEGYSKCAHMSSEEFLAHVHENWEKRMRATMSSNISKQIETCIKIALRCVEIDNDVSIGKLLKKGFARLVGKKFDKDQNPNSASWGTMQKDSGGALQLSGARFFSFKELKSCTENFSDRYQIGSGGYGKVYKGILGDGIPVAIKRAQSGSMQGAPEFKNEIELLSRVHHRNLVSLIGFCFEQGEQMLVYEFVAGGTLRENLVLRGSYMDWNTRLRITLGSARGLAYLHELADLPIIHRDIKSTNILLDENLMAKVADFGLSELLADSIKGHVSTQVKGTLAYLDPEYYMTQHLSEKSDVYSFGVVMLELVSGRQPIQRGKYIVPEVRQVLDPADVEYYGLRAIVDPTIRDAARTAGFRRYVQLAMQCVDEFGDWRPSMGTVVKEVEAMLLNEHDGDGANRNTSSVDH